METPASSAVTGRDSQHAIRFPMAAWPSYEVLFPIAEPSHLSSRLHLKHMSPNQTFVRGDRNDPLTPALKFGGCILATPRDFQTLGADGSIEVPLATKGYQVRAFAERRIQFDGKRDWRMGVGPGPNASGKGANGKKSAKNPRGTG